MAIASFASASRRADPVVSKLASRVALVTGGLRGIGRAIVDRFVAEGAWVVAGDLDTDGRDIEHEYDGRVLYHRLDVGSTDAWSQCWAAAEARFGPVSILVNNAGTSRTGSIADTSDDDWNMVMTTNLFGTFAGCRLAVRSMAARGGVIVNIASARGQRPGSSQCAYSASKAAVLNMTEGIALHCGEQGLPIRCNAICPGIVDTPLLRRNLQERGDDALVALAARQVIGRLGSPGEIADAALFLACDEARFITGATLNVDGGFRIRDL